MASLGQMFATVIPLVVIAAAIALAAFGAGFLMGFLW